MRAAAAVTAAAVLLVTMAGCGASGRSAAKRSSSSAPIVTVTTTATSATPSPRVTLSRSAAPPLGVAVSSATFVSASRGWLIGRTAGQTRVETTTDGGAHWSALAAIPAGSPTGVRFADAAHGYAFSRLALDVTMNGGQSWRQVSVPDRDSGDSMGAVQVEIASGRVWLLNAASPGPAIFESLVGSTDFHQVGTAGNRGADLSVQGPYAYILGLHGAGPVDPNLESRRSAAPARAARSHASVSGPVSARARAR